MDVEEEEEEEDGGGSQRRGGAGLCSAGYYVLSRLIESKLSLGAASIASLYKEKGGRKRESVPRKPCLTTCCAGKTIAGAVAHAEHKLLLTLSLSAFAFG